jgi:hypothetical protein
MTIIAFFPSFSTLILSSLILGLAEPPAPRRASSLPTSWPPPASTASGPHAPTVDRLLPRPHLRLLVAHRGSCRRLASHRSRRSRATRTTGRQCLRPACCASRDPAAGRPPAAPAARGPQSPIAGRPAPPCLLRIARTRHRLASRRSRATSSNRRPASALPCHAPPRGQRLERRWVGEEEPDGATKMWLRLPQLAPISGFPGAPVLEPGVEHPKTPSLAGLHLEPKLEPGLEPCQRGP